ncbi:hypothetical protein ETAA8_67100 [Anatilimnocola aggregata]|uniref:Uncharacterized protein n=1 Tax=Anatilimnocola aggregata TaxID=2528021 RepID=A0A517YMW3_9BACT|nr:DUF1549 domain-containing protein [Anatilimnocola aggregata]QDU31551.1 hypothetical protein ETAA8_67100 [Anatilimnocola aggregata]
MRSFFLLVTALLHAASATFAAEPARVTIVPVDFTLVGPRAQQQLVVSTQSAPGVARLADATRSAKYESSDLKVAEVTAAGIVHPKGDGTAVITATTVAGKVTANVTVSNFTLPVPIDYRTDVMAALSRAGCSQGACHGSPQGKGGFRLSLRGFDPAGDLLTLTREASFRRTNPLEPEQSLILRKGSGRMPHQGGVRFQPTDVAYHVLRDWIAAGCPDSTQPRKLLSLEVLPPSRVLDPSSPQQQLIALARFADGSVVDVTGQAVFTVPHDPAVSVSNDGLVEFAATAEASVLVRYLEQVRSVQLTYVEHDSQYQFRGPAPANIVDEHIFAKQRALQLQPAGLCTDEAFVRRVYLDVLGILPTPEEAKRFLDSPAPDKRDKLIDELLERDEFATYWALKWADVMRGNRTTISLRGVHGLHRYLVDHFAADRPMTDLAKEILTARGNTFENPAASFYRVARTPDEAAEGFGQLFLGIRIGCAKCHNHPFEALTQTDYYGLAAFFSRVKLKGKQFGLDDEVVYLQRQGEVQHPLTKKNLDPVAFGYTPDKVAPEDDRRQPLADWLTAPGNRYFARSTVNRLWYHLLGRGIVEPVDDFRDTNPPSHPELLDALAAELVRSEFKIKPVLKLILRSRTYHLQADGPKQSEQAAAAARYFTQAHVRTITSEQLLDAISSAIGVPDTYPGYPLGTRAGELAEGAVENHFLMATSRPIRDAACDCAREEETDLAAAIHLLNNPNLIKRLGAPEARVAKALAAKQPAREIVEQIYLATLSRRPSEREHAIAENYIKEAGGDEPKAMAGALQDIQHALLNGSEFLLRH